MSTDYQKATLLHALLTPWVELILAENNDEWGDNVRAIQNAATALLGYQDDRTLIMLNWLLDDFDDYMIEPTDPYDPESWERGARKARKQYEAPSFENLYFANEQEQQDTFDYIVERTRDWMRPTDDDMGERVEDDPEYERYVQLKAEVERLAVRFEPGDTTGQ